jgi:alpha/beta hydrolase family protein
VQVRGLIAKDSDQALIFVAAGCSRGRHERAAVSRPDWSSMACATSTRPLFNNQLRADLFFQLVSSRHKRASLMVAHIIKAHFSGYADGAGSPGVLTSGDARQGAMALRSFVGELTREGRLVALLCHSYGSVVCGLAAPHLRSPTSPHSAARGWTRLRRGHCAARRACGRAGEPKSGSATCHDVQLLGLGPRAGKGHHSAGALAQPKRRPPKVRARRT